MLKLSENIVTQVRFIITIFLKIMKQVSLWNVFLKITYFVATLEDPKWFGYRKLKFEIYNSCIRVSNSKWYHTSGCLKYMIRKNTFSYFTLKKWDLFNMVKITEVESWVLVVLIKVLILSFSMFYLLEV